MSAPFLPAPARRPSTVTARQAGPLVVAASVVVAKVLVVPAAGASVVAGGGGALLLAESTAWALSCPRTVRLPGSGLVIASYWFSALAV